MLNSQFSSEARECGLSLGWELGIGQIAAMSRIICGYVPDFDI